MFHMTADGEVVRSDELVHKNFGDYFFCHPNRAARLSDGPFRAAMVA